MQPFKASGTPAPAVKKGRGAAAKRVRATSQVASAAFPGKILPKYDHR